MSSMKYICMKHSSTKLTQIKPSKKKKTSIPKTLQNLDFFLTEPNLLYTVINPPKYFSIRMLLGHLEIGDIYNHLDQLVNCNSASPPT